MLPLYRVTALTRDSRSVTHTVRVDLFEPDETTRLPYYRAISRNWGHKDREPSP
jgi:hypothetical protein